MQRPERPAHPSCGTPPDRSHILLFLHHASDATKFGAPAGAAGFAVTKLRGGFGSTAFLFYERISALSQRTKVSEERLLGYMMPRNGAK